MEKLSKQVIFLKLIGIFKIYLLIYACGKFLQYNAKVYSIFAWLLPHVRIKTCRLILFIEHFDSVHVMLDIVRQTFGARTTYSNLAVHYSVWNTAQFIFHMYFIYSTEISNRHTTQMSLLHRLHWNLFGRRPLWSSLRLS